MADASFYISCVMALALFDIKATKESPTSFTHGEGGVLDGQAIWSVESVSRLLSLSHLLLYSHPKPFKCTITPRSAKAETLITSIDHELS